VKFGTTKGSKGPPVQNFTLIGPYLGVSGPKDIKN